MIGLAWQLFRNTIVLPHRELIWLLLPLCLSVAIVYKTLRAGHYRRIPRDVVVLMAYMTTGLVALAVGLWAVQEYWP